MQKGAIDHTFLMNSTIAMLQNTDKWPTPLYDMGYRIEYIEERIKVDRLGKLEPDIIAKIFEKNKVLLLECKGGKTVDGRQLEKLLNVEGAHVRQIISVRNRKQIATQICYVVKSYSDFIDEVNLVISEIDGVSPDIKSEDDIDAIEITSNTIRVHTSNSNNWSSELIEGVPKDEGVFPQYFIPFSLNDDGEWILKLIARELVSILLKKGRTEKNPSVSARELIESIFKVYKFIQTRKLRLLEDRMRMYIEKLCKKKRFYRKLESIGKGRRITAKSLETAIEELEKYGKEIHEEEQRTVKLEKFL